MDLENNTATTSPSSPQDGLGQGEQAKGEEPLENLYKYISSWSHKLKDAVRLVAEPPPSSSEPFKNVYKAIEDTKLLRIEIQDYADNFKNMSESGSSLWTNFLIRFALIHVYSSLAKWQEICEELKFAEDEHKL